jgi:hypothetical protein
MPIARIQSLTGITSRGPTPDEAGFTLSATQRDTIISPGSTASSVVDDRNMTTHTGATVDREYDLFAQEAVPGTFEPYVRFSSDDEAVAEVCQCGKVTRIADGTARIWCRTVNVNRFYDADVTRQVGATTSVLSSYVTGSLARHGSESIDNLLGNPVTDQSMFSTLNYDTQTYTRNSNFIAANVTGLHGIPVGNSYWRGKLPGIPITPRNMLFSNHTKPSVGSTHTWLAPNGTLVTRTFVDDFYRVGSLDLCVGKLDSDLPDSIPFIKVLPSDAYDYLPSIQTSNQTYYPIPVFAVNQFRKAILRDWYSYVNFSEQVAIALAAPSDTTRFAYSTTFISGDSGSPVFAVINGELVLITLVSPGIDLVTNYSLINSTLTAAGSPYQLTPVSLSAFTDFS